MKCINRGALLVMGLVSAVAAAQEVAPVQAEPPAAPGTTSTDKQPAPTPAEQRVAIKASNNYLEVPSIKAKSSTTTGNSNDAARVQVIPAMMPPSLTKLSFDKVECASSAAGQAADLGAHFDIVWEPLERAPLARDAFLTAGCWQVSLHAVPIPHATQPYVDTSWSRFGMVQGQNTQSNTLCAFRQVGSFSAAAQAPATEPFTAPLQDPTCKANSGWTGIPIVIRSLSLAKPNDLLSRFGNKGEEYTPLPSANRAFGVDSTGLVDDAFQAVADLAVEQAEARVLQAANDLLLERMCGPDSAMGLSTALHNAGVSLEDLKDGKLFGNTCTALEHVRLRDLTSASRNLQQSLLRDGLSIALLASRRAYQPCLNLTQSSSAGCFSSSIQSPQANGLLATSFVSLGTLLGTIVLERRGASLSDAQLIVRQAIGAVESSLQAKAAPLNSMEADLVVAATALAFCHANGRCDTHLIREVLESPEKFFDVSSGGTFPRQNLDLMSFRRNEAQLVNIVTEGLEVMSPKTQADANEAIRHATSFLRYITDYWLQNNCQGSRASQCQLERKTFAQLFDLADAIADRDVPLAITATAAVLGSTLAPSGAASPSDEQRFRLQRVMRYASAMASYAGTYSMTSSSADPDRSREEQRLARKQALRSLVDLGSDRSMRKNEPLLSFSVSPGLRPSWMLASEANGFAFQPSLPLGIALAYQWRSGWGLYGQVYGADVGQYAVIVNTPGEGSSTSKATPYNALTFGGTLGGSYKDFIFGLDGRWTPNLEAGGGEAGAQSWRWPVSLGLHFGYHLPLVTFN
jgi:hypothetical protein